MVLVGDVDTGWRLGGGRMSEKSSLLSDDAASSSSEDVSTTAGCRDVMCVRRAYANSQHEEVASCIHLFFCFIGYAARQLAFQLHQKRTQMVCSNGEARKRPARRHSRNGP